MDDWIYPNDALEEFLEAVLLLLLWQVLGGQRPLVELLHGLFTAAREASHHAGQDGVLLSLDLVFENEKVGGGGRSKNKTKKNSERKRNIEKRERNGRRKRTEISDEDIKWKEERTKRRDGKNIKMKRLSRKSWEYKRNLNNSSEEFTCNPCRNQKWMLELDLVSPTSVIWPCWDRNLAG